MKMWRRGRPHRSKELERQLRKKAREQKKAERMTAGKKQTINPKQFEKLVSELMGQEKTQEQAIKILLEKYEIRWKSDL